MLPNQIYGTYLQRSKASLEELSLDGGSLVCSKAHEEDLQLVFGKLTSQRTRFCPGHGLGHLTFYLIT